MHAIHYTIRPSDPHAHLFDVTLQVEQPEPDGQRLRLPVWIPGSYMVREFARHVEAVQAMVGNRAVAIEKVDKNTWACGRLPAAGRLLVSYRVYAWDLSVRAAHLDASHGFFNGTSVFLAVAGREDEPCSVDILPPRGSAFRRWAVATALPAMGGNAGSRAGFGRYEAVDYDELIEDRKSVV